MTSRGRAVLALLFTAALIAGAGIYGFYFSNWLLIKNITVEGNSRASDEQIIDLAQIQLDTPLIDLNTEQIISSLIEIDSVKEIEVRKGWPDSVVIVVTERVPIALTDLTDGRYLVDDTGKAFHRAGPDDVYRFVFAPNDPARGLAARVANTVPEYLVSEISRVESFNGRSATIILNSGRRIVWGDEFKSADKASVLRVLLRTDEGDIDVSTPEVPVLKTPSEVE
jgi:cell division protein FtsQ